MSSYDKIADPAVFEVNVTRDRLRQFIENKRDWVFKGTADERQVEVGDVLLIRDAGDPEPRCRSCRLVVGRVIEVGTGSSREGAAIREGFSLVVFAVEAVIAAKPDYRAIREKREEWKRMRSQVKSYGRGVGLHPKPGGFPANAEGVDSAEPDEVSPSQIGSRLHSGDK